MIINLSWMFFFWDVTDLKLEIGHKGKNISWETLHVWKALILLDYFSINPAHKFYFVDFKTFVIKFRKIWTRWEKMAFIFVYSRRKANWIFEVYSWEFFLPTSVNKVKKTIVALRFACRCVMEIIFVTCAFSCLVVDCIFVFGVRLLCVYVLRSTEATMLSESLL